MTKKNAGGAPLPPAAAETRKVSRPPNFHTEDGRHVHVPSWPLDEKGYDISLAMLHA